MTVSQFMHGALLFAAGSAAMALSALCLCATVLLVVSTIKAIRTPKK